MGKYLEIEYFCEMCKQKFTNATECITHEKECQKKENFTCDKCGKTIEYIRDKELGKEQACWKLQPNHYKAEYGSILDGCQFILKLCDDCLANFINTLQPEAKARIYNSGSNVYGSNKTWAKYFRGEILTLEEEIEIGINAEN